MKGFNLTAKKPAFLFVLFLSTFFIFFGRSIESLLWEVPLRAFFWDEGWLKPIIEGVFNYDWYAYSTNPMIDQGIQVLNDILGGLLTLSTLAVIFLYQGKFEPYAKVFIIIGSIIVGIILLLEYKEKFYHLAQFLEGFIQFFTPIVLLLFLNQSLDLHKTKIVLKLIVAFTFIGHGLYAVNLYATPGNFIDMIIVLLGFSEPMAKNFLILIGYFDILLIVLLLIPYTEKLALYYAIIWGLLTALARFAYYFKLNGYDISSLEAIHATIYRLPHGLVPLSILL
ncbi:MAG: hypothetical protein ACR2MS_11200, partial [Weeksellaceae bacterium]